MIYFRIGAEERLIALATPQWIAQAIQGARREGARICVTVRFAIPGISLVLATPGCPSGPGRSASTFNRDEQQLIEEWRSLGLFEDPDFGPGPVISFRQCLIRRFGVAA